MFPGPTHVPLSSRPPNLETLPKGRPDDGTMNAYRSKEATEFTVDALLPDSQRVVA